jgi:hypothetical protein
MRLLGVGECFFGPAWGWPERRDWAGFLQKQDLSLYVYGPKADSFLRGRWREEWPPEYVGHLKAFATICRDRQVELMVAFSPFGLSSFQDIVTRDKYNKKLDMLLGLGIGSLGIFFDDMNYSEGALEVQLEAIELAARRTQLRLLYCPTFYSLDPVLDKVFGKRPENYLESLGRMVPQGVDICWTGPKVISDEISVEHMEMVRRKLGRKPFLFDNFFANDGPKNCKYLKLKELQGRSPELLDRVSGWVFNPMNQSALSRVVVSAAFQLMQENVDSQEALKDSLACLSSPRTAEFLWKNRGIFAEKGLDQIPEEERRVLSECLRGDRSLVASEVKEWLTGKYTVGSECLTD